MKTSDRLAEGESPRRRTPGHEADGATDGPPDDAAGAPPKSRAPASGHHLTHTPAHMAMMRAAAVARYGPSGGRGRPCKGHLKVDEMLRDEDRPAYAAFLSDPTHTRADAVHWLGERGYVVGRNAVQTHRRQFKTMLRELRSAANFGTALGNLVKQYGPMGLTDITVTRLQQCLMERLMAVDEDDKSGKSFRDIPLDELKELTKLIDTAVDGRRVVESMRQEFDQAKRLTADEATRVAKGGGDGRAVANRVRELLGMPLGDEPADA